MKWRYARWWLPEKKCWIMPEIMLHGHWFGKECLGDYDGNVAVMAWFIPLGCKIITCIKAVYVGSYLTPNDTSYLIFTSNRFKVTDNVSSSSYLSFQKEIPSPVLLLNKWMGYQNYGVVLQFMTWPFSGLCLNTHPTY